jgi:hypothetical protein
LRGCWASAKPIEHANMRLPDYAKRQFASDLMRLEIHNHNSLLRRCLGADAAGGMFGGRRWVRIASDLATVPEDRRACFCLCLFTMTCTDQNMHAHFRSHHLAYRRMSPHPKFGWTGFGMNVEHPRLLLEMPSAAGVDFSVITDEDLEQFMRDQMAVAPQFLQGIHPLVFFRDMLNDPGFTADVDVFRSLKGVMDRFVG